METSFIIQVYAAAAADLTSIAVGERDDDDKRSIPVRLMVGTCCTYT